MMEAVCLGGSRSSAVISPDILRDISGGQLLAAELDRRCLVSVYYSTKLITKGRTINKWIRQHANLLLDAHYIIFTGM